MTTDVLYTIGVHQIDSHVWPYPVCNIHQHQKLDESHQLLLSLVTVMLHWLLTYLNVTNIKSYSDIEFMNQQKTFPSGRHGCISVDAFHQSHQ